MVVPTNALTGEEWLTDCEKGYYWIGKCSFILDWNTFYKQVKDCGKNCGFEKNDHNYNSFVGTCIPQGVTRRQIVRILMQWLNEHPERLHEFMYHLYGMILLETFPCGQIKNSLPSPPSLDNQ